MCFFITFSLHGQSDKTPIKESSFFNPELHIGKTIDANTDFPETNLQKNIFLSWGSSNYNPDKEWAARLNYPKTGISIGYTDFGNSEKIGQAFSLLPFIEVSPFKKRPKINLQIGFGASYMNTQYDEINNPFNRAISTDVSWSFRSFLYYDLHKRPRTTYRFGLGYLHHSNGHTRLPNQGLNSLSASFSAKIHSKRTDVFKKNPHHFKRKSQNYLSWRAGFGLNVLSEEFNDKKSVYSFAMSAGKIINNTFKFGGGFYYRFYEHYYDYINNNGDLVEEFYPHFRDNPYGYATNFGLFATSELLLGHVGFEFDIGINIYKPAYKIDWQLNQGYSFKNASGETIVILGELDWYYEIKRTISSRMGLKYYLWSTSKAPKHNFFLGAHINANLGQADFTELSLGYTYRFNYKESSN